MCVWSFDGYWVFDASDTKEAGGHQTEKQTSRQIGSELSFGNLLMSLTQKHTHTGAWLILIGHEACARIRVTT